MLFSKAAHAAHIRIVQKGVIVYQESQTFDRKTMAQAVIYLGAIRSGARSCDRAKGAIMSVHHALIPGGEQRSQASRYRLRSPSSRLKVLHRDHRCN
ncbi:hypothetical protein C6382_01790 [Pseudomonas sp. BBP2017]|nr:hypothetical protein C6382_01790 [Pseudomonas sp. BBP2017]